MYSFTTGGKNGKKITLEESSDRVVVRTKNARKLKDAVSSKESKKVLKNFEVEMEFPDSNVTILKVKKPRIKKPMPSSPVTSSAAVPESALETPESKSLQIEMRDSARATLKQEPELQFAGRVLQDEVSKSPVLYTENLFIKFHDDVSADTVTKILGDFKLNVAYILDKNTFVVKPQESPGLKVFEISESLLQKPEVELCHPELVRKKSKKIIHPDQWHLKETKIGQYTINAHVHIDEAHLLSRGKNIVIAIIDDGVDIDHPEFNIPGKVVNSKDITSNSNDPRPRLKSDHHGTQCAGVATASGMVASGVAPEANLMPIRLGVALGDVREALAFKWALDHGADIISCSWGPEDGVWYHPHDRLHTQDISLMDSTQVMLDRAVREGRNGKGCVIFFASGNGNEDIQFDGYASYEKVIAIAACNDTNKRSVYSDYGDRVWCCFPSSDDEYKNIHHPAPLTNGIYTTDRKGSKGVSRTNYVSTFGGTSSSCPGAAGTAALMLSANPELTWEQVRDILKDTSEKIDRAHGDYDAQGHSRKYGYGKINAHKAVLKAIELRTINSI